MWGEVRKWEGVGGAVSGGKRERCQGSGPRPPPTEPAEACKAGPEGCEGAEQTLGLMRAVTSVRCCSGPEVLEKCLRSPGSAGAAGRRDGEGGGKRGEGEE